MGRRVVILADESAHWKIAGMRQLERVALEATMPNETMELCILWRPGFPPEQRFRPQHPRLSHLEITTELPASVDLLLSTHLFLHRNIVPSQLPATAPKPHDLQRSFTELSAAVRAGWQKADPNEGWEYLENPAQIDACEIHFLRENGKSQDGLISRFINRPISRAISRVLLKTPITPTAWTLLIFVLPFVGAVFLSRGDYLSIVAGLSFFQIYSILDGCDGEIARAKYLESVRGRQLDTWCDVLGNLFMALALGYGLSRQPAFGSFYLAEGSVVAALIATNEMILGLSRTNADRRLTARIGDAVYPRHQQTVEQSGLLFFGERFAWWLIQLTKRDVAILGFLFLALAGQPGWILHLLGAVAAISSLLAVKARLR